MSEIKFKPASLRGDWFRWLADRPPASRVLTREECHVLAREADGLFEQLEVYEKALREIGERPLIYGETPAEICREALGREYVEDMNGVLHPVSNPASSLPEYAELEGTLADGLDDGVCSCGGKEKGNINFDRSVCACGAMHYYCDDCGCQAEPCDPDPASSPNAGSRPEGRLP